MRIEGEPTPGQIELTNTYLRHRFKVFILGQVIGLVPVVFGLVLLLFSVTGSTSFFLRTFGLQLEVNDAVPGIVFVFAVGLVMWATRYWVDVDLTGTHGGQDVVASRDRRRRSR